MTFHARPKPDARLQSRLCRMGRALRRSCGRHGVLDRLLHYAVVIQIKGLSYCLRQYATWSPKHVRSKPLITPPPAIRPEAARPTGIVSGR